MVPLTPLHRPFATFREPPKWITNPAVIVGLTLGSAVLLAVAVYALGQVLAAQTTGTVTVDNPAYPGDAFCENPAFEETQPDRYQPGGCDEPETVERDPSAIVSEAFAQVAGLLLFGWLFLWLLGGIALHVAAWLANGRGTPGDSFAIASWSGAASALTAIPSVVVLALAVQSTDIAMSDPERTRQTLEAAIGPVEPFLLLFGLIGTTWQAVIWYAGLVELHDVDGARAAFISGVFWLLLMAGSL